MNSASEGSCNPPPPPVFPSLSVDKTSALSDGNRGAGDSADGAILSSEILVGVVVGGCVLVLVAALAVGAVCYKQKTTPDKRNLVHASSIGLQMKCFCVILSLGLFSFRSTT